MENKNIFLIYLGRSGAGPKITLDLTKEITETSEVKNFNLLVSKNNLLLTDIKKYKDDLFIVSTPVKKLDTLTKLPNFIIIFLRKLIKSKNRVFLFPMTHIWNPVAMLIIKIFNKNSKIFFICHDATIHPGEKNSFLQYKLMRLEIFLSNHLFCLSKNVKNILEKRYPKKSIILLPHPAFDFGIIKEPRNINNIPTFLFFGRIVKYKGLDLFLKSIEIFDKVMKSKNYDYKVVIAGDGEIEKEDLDIINNNKNIELINRYIDEKEIPEIWNKSDICVLPYIEASQSGVIAIAINKAMPCIITPMEGLIEQCDAHNKENTFAIVSKDISPVAISEKMLEMLDKNNYNKLSQNALNKQKQFGWGKWIDVLIK